MDRAVQDSDSSPTSQVVAHDLWQYYKIEIVHVSPGHAEAGSRVTVPTTAKSLIKASARYSKMTYACQSSRRSKEPRYEFEPNKRLLLCRGIVIS
jgi:hypothetical protein